MIIPLLIGAGLGYAMRPRVSVDPKKGLYVHKAAFGAQARAVASMPVRELRSLDHRMGRWIAQHEEWTPPSHLKAYTAQWLKEQRVKHALIKAELQRRGY